MNNLEKDRDGLFPRTNAAADRFGKRIIALGIIWKGIEIVCSAGVMPGGALRGRNCWLINDFERDRDRSLKRAEWYSFLPTFG